VSSQSSLAIDTRDQPGALHAIRIPIAHGTVSVAPGTAGASPVNNRLRFQTIWSIEQLEEASENLHSTNNFPDHRRFAGAVRGVLHSHIVTKPRPPSRHRRRHLRSRRDEWLFKLGNPDHRPARNRRLSAPALRVLPCPQQPRAPSTTCIFRALGQVRRLQELLPSRVQYGRSTL